MGFIEIAKSYEEAMQYLSIPFMGFQIQIVRQHISYEGLSIPFMGFTISIKNPPLNAKIKLSIPFMGFEPKI